MDKTRTVGQKWLVNELSAKKIHYSEKILRKTDFTDLVINTG